MSSGICDGRVVIVTGAARGIGRAHALEFARQGAKVVVNDLGGERDGTGASAGPAQEVVDEIRAAGGTAVANGDSVADWDGAERLINQAIEEFGRLDVLVNNAGILRDRVVANMTEQEWDAVINVHLKGTFAPMRHAIAYWRAEAKAGRPVDARVINTSSSSGIFNNPGQANYGAAKAGIASLTIIASREVEKYGVTVNAIYPTALSRMTEDIFAMRRPQGAENVDREELNRQLGPDNVAPLVVWLGSPESAGITGRVFGVRGGKITVAEGWHAGPTAEREGRWDPAELGNVVPGLVEKAAENALTSGEIPEKTLPARGTTPGTPEGA